MRMRPEVLIYACWAAWAGYWWYQARSAKPMRQRMTRASRARYAVLLGAAMGLMAPLHGDVPPLNRIVIPPSVPLDWAGVAICWAGAAFAVWARVTLAGNWSGVVSLKHDHEIIDRGPYAYVRHPIYTGILAMILGSALLEFDVARTLAVALAFLSFRIKLGQEENLLSTHFPGTYPAYAARTRRLIPFLY